MQYTKDMLLESQSGFMMPFEADDDHEVSISLDFGEQTHPMTGKPFNHHGIDLVASHVPLYAVASGTVIGLGTDAIHENYIITKYGKYEVKYGHISEGYVGYGQPVVAGQPIAKSGDFLHMEVNYAGEILDPKDFIGMLYSNVEQINSLGQPLGRFANMGIQVKTDYDADQEEILQMMQRWIASYFNDIRIGAYAPPARTENTLRNIFAQSAQKNYFFESMPTISNPLGLSGRGAPLAGKVQNVLIGDFLNYMALKHNVFLSSWTDEQKKKVSEQAAVDGLVVDPLSNLQIDIKNYDVNRTASIYFDSEGNRCWTKAWFNGREKGEPAVEISRNLAIAFIKNEISKDSWLTRFYPKQMSFVNKAIEQTRQQLLGLNI